jgi:2-methylisocitrate lyase-like PEP mutase family enzyme
LILPNPWDAGTAKLLASVGFEALATTSLGMSNALGRVDGEGSVSRAELLENCRVIAEANVVMSAADPALTAAEMEAVGVKRLSVGGALSRLALAAFMKGAREMKEQGGFTWVRDAMPTPDLKTVFGA